MAEYIQITAEDDMKRIIADAKKAKNDIAHLSGAKKNEVLQKIADALLDNTDAILKANAEDVKNARGNIKDSMIDRLTLTEARIKGICDSVRKVAYLNDPTGDFEGFTRPNGLIIERHRVPFGIIGIIYESRPNVTADSIALCVKSGNVCILRGGKESINTNKVIAEAARSAIRSCGLDENIVTLIGSTDRAYTYALMRARGDVDLIIPRGGAGLISFVKDNSLVPTIETGAGNCHLFINRDADMKIALDVLINAKTQRPSVCNAIETLVVHSDIAESFLPKADEALASKNVEIRADEKAIAYMAHAKAADDADFFTEYDDLIIAVHVVSSLDEAIEFINAHSTKHSESIITRSLEDSAKFSEMIDSACVYTNASTRFTDGDEFGFGAEIGISTGKLHARGPMGLKELTCVKYIIKGEGQVRT